MASINNEIITLSDVFLFGQINFLLSQQFKSSSEVLDKIPISLDRNKIARLTKDLIVVEILNQELIKFNMGHIDPETAVKNFLSLFPANISYEKLLIKTNSSNQKFSVLLSKKYSAQFFLNSKFTPDNIFIPKNEIDEFIKTNNLKPTKHSINRITKLLKEEKNQARIVSFIENLLNRSDIKYIPYEI